MQHFQTELHYPRPVSAFKEMLESETYLLEKYAWLGEEEVEILNCGEKGGIFCVEVRRIVPIEVPRFAGRFLSPKSHVHEKDEWEIFEPHLLKGIWTVQVKGAPFQLEGTMDVKPSGEGCVQMVTGTVSSAVPLIGRRLERFIAEDARKKIEREGEFNRAWLGR